MSDHEIPGLHNTSRLHVPCLEGLQYSNLEVAINRDLQKIQFFQVAGQFCIFVLLAVFDSSAPQICRVAVDAKEMMSADMPKPEIRITPVVNVQPTVDMYERLILTSCLAGLIDRSMQCR